MPYVDLSGGATQVQLTFEGSLLEELQWAEEERDKVLRTLSDKHFLLFASDNGGYENEVSNCTNVASLRGTNWSRDGYHWSAVLEFEAYDPDNPQQRILNDEQNSLPIGIVVLSDHKSVGERSGSDSARTLLGDKSLNFSLQEGKETRSEWLSELNGEEGLLCDWYRFDEESAMASLELDKLPRYKSRPKQKALLRGRLTLHLNLTGAPMTGPVREDRSLQLTNPQGEASSSQEVEGSTVAPASASSGATDAESDLVNLNISHLSIG